MLYPSSLTPKSLGSVEATLSSPRLARYDQEIKGNSKFALQLYIWNGRLCETFYLAVRFAEAAVRNAIHLPIGKNSWGKSFGNGSFKDLFFPQ